MMNLTLILTGRVLILSLLFLSWSVLGTHALYAQTDQQAPAQALADAAPADADASPQAPENAAAGAAASDTSDVGEIEQSMADLEFVQQALDSLRQEMESSKESANLNRTSVQSIRDGLALIDEKLQDAYNKLDDSRASIATNKEALDKLINDLQSASRAVRANATELDGQKSLIEDNAVRLYEILIQISDANEKSAELNAALQNVKRIEGDDEAQLVTETKLNQLRSLFSTVVIFFVILAYTLSGRHNRSWHLADGVSQQQGALPVCLVAAAGYIILGFGLMYGASASGLLGVSSYLFGVIDSELTLSVPFADFQLYQNGFVMLASLIVYTAVGRQLSSATHVLLALIVGSVLIPVFGHWAWSENFVSGNRGWLQNLGFIDESGSTVINVVAASFALVLAWKLGDRAAPPLAEETAADEAKIPVYPATAVVFLWLSWLGFTTGDLPIASEQVSDVMLNVNLSASAGGIMAFLYHVFFKTDRSDMAGGLGGFVSGLVAIAACAQSVTVAEAAVIGAVAGILQHIAYHFVGKWFLKHGWQAWGAYLVAIHGAGGVWGTLCVALFGTEGSFALPNIIQLTIQFQGIGVGIVYSVVMANVTMAMLKYKKRQLSTADAG